ncbi:hypothetical protein [Erythrobacter sp. QSSC1-22B]|uniref:hypothetical protein n=1 Tax=Erythrobacter sp. QSSC1-22B TaxID=1860125 RepID=UPI000A831B40|nr:hypothetical protein [Erythrobacter sp. QSSC1-22B]
MEYEIDDDPQGEKDKNLGDRTGGIVEDHRALKNQSSVKATDYPVKDRRAQSLVGKKK